MAAPHLILEQERLMCSLKKQW